ncbi:hypothetical protein GCM10009733_021350 [Nonomuraea maheshkhaliensis]|uniref:Uncharacterized protein n=1 Tax=Nonomuraea maheshkhaliensis TaxID=419590 RepID=A0ABN2EZX9_9ACTN
MVFNLLKAALALGLTLVCLAIALPAQKRGKASRFVGVAMLTGGLGPVPVCWVAANEITSQDWKTGIGVFTLAALLAAVGAIGWDWKDGQLDRMGQWLMLALPSLALLVILTIDHAAPWLFDRAASAVNLITSGAGQ